MKMLSDYSPETRTRRIIFEIEDKTLAHVMENVLIERILQHASEQLWQELRPQLEATVREGLTSAIMLERVGDEIVARLIKSILKEPTK